jgi:hypothetical protein
VSLQLTCFPLSLLCVASVHPPRGHLC